MVYWRTLLGTQALRRHADWLASRPGGGAPEQDASGPRGADAESLDGGPIVPAWSASGLRRTHHTDGQRLVLERQEVKLATLVGEDLRLAGFFDTTFSLGNFTLASLTGLEAARCVFERCELEFARLDQARLAGCTFKDCHAVGVHLEGALVSGGGFPGSSLARTDWEGAEALEVDLRGVCFVRARLGDGRFVRCDLRDADLEEADVSRASFVGCDLRGASFVKAAALAGARFVDCQGAP